MKSLVTYFSITGVTETVAAHLADAIGADLFEITARQSLETAPEGEADCANIQFVHKNIEGYDRIYVGLPIWWYAAPTIIQNFLADYDLMGKTVIPFATSGGGGLDKVRPRLLDFCRGADLKEAALLHEDMTSQELRRWAASV